MSTLLITSLRSKFVTGNVTDEEINQLNDMIISFNEGLGLKKHRNDALINKSTMDTFLEHRDEIIMTPGEVTTAMDLNFEFFDSITNEQIGIYTLIQAYENDNERLFAEVKLSSPWDQVSRYISYNPEEGLWKLSEPGDCSENGVKDIVGSSDEILEALIAILWKA